MINIIVSNINYENLREKLFKMFPKIQKLPSVISFKYYLYYNSENLILENCYTCNYCIQSSCRYVFSRKKK